MEKIIKAIRVRATMLGIAACFLSIQAMGQTGDRIISNDKISFELGRKSLKILSADSVRPSGYFVIVHDAAPLQQYLMGLAPQDVIRLLEDEKSDWATNLLLYSIYRKEAHLYFTPDILTREEWVKSLRAKDVEYWKKFIGEG